MADANTIHRVAELLFEAAVEHKNDLITAFKGEVDSPTNVVYRVFTIAIVDFPPNIRAKMTESVERNVIAYLADLGIIARIVEHEHAGRAFHLSIPGELSGFSWDDVLRSFGQESGDAALP